MQQFCATWVSLFIDVVCTIYGSDCFYTEYNEFFSSGGSVSASILCYKWYVSYTVICNVSWISDLTIKDLDATIILTTLWIINEVSFAIACNVKYNDSNFVSIQCKQNNNSMVNIDDNI